MTQMDRQREHGGTAPCWRLDRVCPTKPPAGNFNRGRNLAQGAVPPIDTPACDIPSVRRFRFDIPLSWVTMTSTTIQPVPRGTRSHCPLAYSAARSSLISVLVESVPGAMVQCCKPPIQKYQSVIRAAASCGWPCPLHRRRFLPFRANLHGQLFA